MRKIKRGHGKCKGKLPFKGFECGRVGNFASKFPLKKVETMIVMKSLSIKNKGVYTNKEGLREKGSLLNKGRFYIPRKTTIHPNKMILMIIEEKYYSWNLFRMKTHKMKTIITLSRKDYQ